MFNCPHFALLVCPFVSVCSKFYKVQIHEFRVTHFWFKDTVVLVSLAAFLEVLVRDHKREVEHSRTKTEVSEWLMYVPSAYIHFRNRLFVSVLQVCATRRE